jgi:hypothetical protein
VEDLDKSYLHDRLNELKQLTCTEDKMTLVSEDGDEKTAVSKREKTQGELRLQRVQEWNFESPKTMFETKEAIKIKSEWRKHGTVLAIKQKGLAFAHFGMGHCQLVML